MAGTTSGSFYANTSTNAYRFILYWTITNQGISGSTAYSDVTFTFKGKRLNTSYNSFNGGAGYSFTVDNASTPTASGSLNFDSRNWANDGTEYTLWSSSVPTRVNHTSTGSRTLPLSFTLTTGTAGAGTVTVSGSAVLQDIAMAGTLSLSSSSLTISNSTGPTQRVTISQYQASYNYKVEWKIGSTLAMTTTVAANAGSGSSYSKDCSLGASAFGPAMANTKSATVTANLYTYSGSTQIGTASTKTFTLNFAIAPTANTPTVTAKGNPSGISGYIKGKTYATVAISGASSPNSGSIKSYTFYQAGAAQSTTTTTSTSASWDSSVLNSAGSVTFMVRVTDSRGNYVDKSASAITVNDYAGPKITSYNAYRVSSGSTADPSGTSIYYTASGSVSASAQGNAISSFKVTIGSTSSTASTSSSISGTLSSFPITNAYTATFSLSDKMGNSTTAIVPIPTASRVINVKENKKGIAFGKIAETDNLVESAWDIKAPFFNGNRAFIRSLISSDNLNDIKDFGMYFEPSDGASYMPSNVPSGLTSAFTLEVLPANGIYANSGAWVYLTQRLKPYNSIKYYERMVYTVASGTWVYGAWEELPAQTENIIVTAGTNVSINSSATNVVRNGKIVSGYIRFTSSAQISAYSYVVTGLPVFATSAVFTLLNEYNGQYTSPVLYADAGNSGLRVGAANMAAGTYNVSFTYICQ